MLLDFQKSLELLEKYSIQTADSQVFENKNEATEFAENIGYPVVVKIWGDDILHRSELKGVRVNIKNEKELGNAFDDLKKIAPQIIIQKMENGHQVYVGIKHDPQFGKVIMFGLGGIFVEILKDVSFRLCPLNKAEALEMIKEIKGFSVLNGARGGEVANLDSLAEFLVAVSKLAENEEEIKEIDFNPVMAGKEKVLAVDFKIIR
jgi:acetyl-CoA synthetase (ADP-forming)